jgi:hypothetical protein
MNNARRYLNALMITGVAATTALIAYPAPAGAEGLDVGSDCPPDQIGIAATASDGAAVRCAADEQGAIHWLPDTAAVSTIAALQAQGYTLTVDRVGDNALPSCNVTEVHNPMVTTERAGSGGTSPGGPGSVGNKHATTIVISKKIDVSLDCTGA